MLWTLLGSKKYEEALSNEHPLRQESSNRATDISKLTNERSQGSQLETLSVKNTCQFSTKAQKLPIAETKNLQLSMSETMSCITGKSKTLLTLL